MGYCQLGQRNHWPSTNTFSVINSSNMFSIGASVLWHKYVFLTTMGFSVKNTNNFVTKYGSVASNTSSVNSEGFHK